MDHWSKRTEYDHHFELWSHFSAGTWTSPRLVGMLFARPEHEVVSKEVLPSLMYYDARSADNVYFFFVAYQKGDWLDKIDEGIGKWEPNQASETVFYKVENTPNWYFSPEEFDYWRRYFEAQSTWQYSGGVDMLLFNLRFKDPEEVLTYDFSKTIVLKLDHIKEKKVVVGLGSLFEQIFRYCENPDPVDPVSGLSDFLGLSSAKQSFLSVLCSFMPKESGKEFEKIANFAMADLSKK